LAVVVRSSGGAGVTGWTAAVETNGAVVGLKLPPAVLGATWSARRRLERIAVPNVDTPDP
jgi:hypothetical protein